MSGCSISVVRLLWEQIGRVRFSAPRHKTQPEVLRHSRGNFHITGYNILTSLGRRVSDYTSTRSSLVKIRNLDRTSSILS